MGFVSGHGGDDDGDDEEGNMEKYEEAGKRWRRAVRKLSHKKLWL